MIFLIVCICSGSDIYIYIYALDLKGQIEDVPTSSPKRPLDSTFFVPL